jgi:hypothetical protein
MAVHNRMLQKGALPYARQKLRLAEEVILPAILLTPPWRARSAGYGVDNLGELGT